mmetsp:Transcript_29965/g.54285  ORF Transcript_29965/g.54285 Transcript_29965/m.54285 type:complete len:272 (-) Transcript_29965:201-1016(-)
MQDGAHEVRLYVTAQSSLNLALLHLAQNPVSLHLSLGNLHHQVFVKLLESCEFKCQFLLVRQIPVWRFEGSTARATPSRYLLLQVQLHGKLGFGLPKPVFSIPQLLQQSVDALLGVRDPELTLAFKHKSCCCSICAAGWAPVWFLSFCLRCLGVPSVFAQLGLSRVQFIFSLQMLPLEGRYLSTQLHHCAQLRCVALQKTKLRHKHAGPGNQLIGDFSKSLCSLAESLLISPDCPLHLCHRSVAGDSLGAQGLVVFEGLGPALLLALQEIR